MPLIAIVALSLAVSWIVADIDRRLEIIEEQLNITQEP